MFLRRIAETLAFSFLLMTRASSRVAAPRRPHVCAGERLEGDKWFDGCRWCVCAASGPVCSAMCSDLVMEIPPCGHVDSMWLDGSYLCKCYTHGIECTADRVLAEILFSENLDWTNPFYAECVKNNPHHCVCGLDGVPSCTAQAIDRSLYPNAKTFILQTPVPFSSSLIAPRNVYYEKRNRNTVEKKPRNFDGSASEPRYVQDSEFYPSRHVIFRRDLRRDSDEDIFRDDKSTKRTSHRRHSDNLIRNQEKYLAFYDFYENYFHNSKNRHEFGSSSNKNVGGGGGESHNNDYLKENYESEALPGVYGYAPVYKDYNKGPRVGSDHHKRPSEGSGYRRANGRHGRNWRQEEKTAGDELVYDEPKTFKKSVVAVSDNRCRFGVRWYGGSLRCYCNKDDGSITCGNPSLVALRFDVYRLKGSNCDEGQWHDSGESCQHCECLTNGILYCERSELCPLPLLISPISVDLGNFNDRKDTGHNTGEFKGQDVENLLWDNYGDGGKTTTKIDPVYDVTDFDVTDGAGDVVRSRQDATDDNLDDVDSVISSGEADDLEPANEFVDKRGPTKKPNKKPDRNRTTTPTNGKIHRGKPNAPDSKATSVVIVQECKPGRAWSSGCRKCKCSASGKKFCDDSKCKNVLKTTSTTTTTTTTASTTTSSTTTPSTTEAATTTTSTSPPTPPTTIYRRPRPKSRPEPQSVLTVVREGPVIRKPLFDARPCGRFNESEQYWVDCNLCICMKQGPKCTAKSCR
ncbi:unnamed protein product [Lymnaea stagnalis]|uniref:Uncharacterized protein n=1 Tax=Lymnaea stagnalis TaxID=6523 RepID=A0AAV2ICH3_LYMST